MKRKESLVFIDGQFDSLFPSRNGSHKHVSIQNAVRCMLTMWVSSARHIDAALYGLSPPKVTTLYAVKVPSGEPQVCRYDDGTGDEVKVPLGGTVCE